MRSASEKRTAIRVLCGILCVLACLWQARLSFKLDQRPIEEVLDGIWWLPATTTNETNETLSESINETQKRDLNLRIREPGKGTYSRTVSLSEVAQNDNNQTGEDDYFSACLIIMDDNHWLIEWIAYHYYTAPLRHLIVVQDPRSFTSPRPILDRWKGRMMIEEWTDDRFLPKWVHRIYQKEKKKDLWLHQNRQIFFFSQCMKHLKNQNKSWVLLTDTDEFLRVNRAPTDQYPKGIPKEMLQQPGHVMSFLQQHKVGQKCLTVPRIQVTSQEPPKLKSVSAFNTSQFMTYRWLYHNGEEMNAGKSVVNVQYLSLQDIPRKTDSVHVVMNDVCPPNPGDRRRLNVSSPESDYLSIQHYLGTFEQFTYRSDPRNDDGHERLEQWHTRGRHPPANVRDEGMTQWLPGFVHFVGLEEAKRLLEGVGELEPKPKNVVAAQTLKKNATKTSHRISLQQNFSACLLTMDDNHWLIEWLAYHYHVLPLRDLIVVRDPRSRTSSDEIFARWQDRIKIDFWKDDEVIPKWVFRKHGAGSITDALLHRYRQQFFFSKCLKEFKSRGKSWVLLTDTDEFIRPNSYYSDSVPSVAQAGSVSEFLQETAEKLRMADNSYHPPKCLHVPRLQIAAKESDAQVASAGLPSAFNGSAFVTTRWLYHNEQEITTGHGLDGKNVINIEKLKLEEIPRKAENVHNVLPDLCPATDGGRLRHQESWLVIHHYLGTYEQYSFRDDPRDAIKGRPRRAYSLWNSTGQNPPASRFDDSMRPWITGFIDSVGRAEASRLLEGVGKVDSHR